MIERLTIGTWIELADVRNVVAEKTHHAKDGRPQFHVVLTLLDGPAGAYRRERVACASIGEARGLADEIGARVREFQRAEEARRYYETKEAREITDWMASIPRTGQPQYAKTKRNGDISPTTSACAYAKEFAAANKGPILDAEMSQKVRDAMTANVVSVGRIDDPPSPANPFEKSWSDSDTLDPRAVLSEASRRLESSIDGEMLEDLSAGGVHASPACAAPPASIHVPFPLPTANVVGGRPESPVAADPSAEPEYESFMQRPQML